MNCRFWTCHKCSSARGTLWLGIVLFQDDPMLGKTANVWRLISKIALIFTKTLLTCDPSKSTPHWIFVENLDGWVVPRDIVESKIVGKNENDVGLSVELGPPLLLREAGVAQCHQEGDQHSSSQIILLEYTYQSCPNVTYYTGEGNTFAIDYAGFELGILLCVDLCQIYVQTCVLLLVHSLSWHLFFIEFNQGRLYMADSGHDRKILKGPSAKWHLCLTSLQQNAHFMWEPVKVWRR